MAGIERRINSLGGSRVGCDLGACDDVILFNVCGPHGDLSDSTPDLCSVPSADVYRKRSAPGRQCHGNFCTLWFSAICLA